MKAIKYAALMFAAVALVSCSNKGDNADSNKKAQEEQVPLEARTAEASIMEGAAVTGDEAEFFTISGAQGASNVTITGTPDAETPGRGEVTTTIDITMVKPFGQAVHDLGSNSSYDLELMDASNNTLLTLSPSDADKESLETMVKSGTPGTVTMHYSASEYDKEYDELFEKVKSVRLVNAEIRSEEEWNNSGSSSDDVEVGISEGEGDTEGGSEGNDEGSSSVSASSGSNDWDAVLDEYESYVNKMTKYVTRMANGDPTAGLEYASAQADALAMYEKMEKAKSDMTAAQVRRMNSILAKYNKALQKAL